MQTYVTPAGTGSAAGIVVKADPASTDGDGALNENFEILNSRVPGKALLSYLVTGAETPTTTLYDYNAYVAKGTGIYTSDGQHALANGPSGAWFSVSIVGRQPPGFDNFFGQLVISDQGCNFRGGTVAAPGVWQSLLTDYSGIGLYTLDGVGYPLDYFQALHVKPSGFWFSRAVGGIAIADAPSGSGFSGCFTLRYPSADMQVAIDMGGVYFRSGWWDALDPWKRLVMAPLTPPEVTGSRGGNEAVASLLAALAGLGLITNNTTA